MIANWTGAASVGTASIRKHEVPTIIRAHAVVLVAIVKSRIRVTTAQPSPASTHQGRSAIVGDPHETVIKKVKTRLQDVHREWLAATPMIFVATSDADGRVDVSPKGDPAGKIAHVIDDRTIAIPERPGNRRVDGYLNILSNPRVGTISVIPRRGDTLRINGTARIVDDGPYFDDLAVRDQRPILAVEISTDEVYFHCAKAFLRSELWKPDTWRPTRWRRSRNSPSD